MWPLALSHRWLKHHIHILPTKSSLLNVGNSVERSTENVHPFMIQSLVELQISPIAYGQFEEKFILTMPTTTATKARKIMTTTTMEKSFSLMILRHSTESEWETKTDFVNWSYALAQRSLAPVPDTSAFNIVNWKMLRLSEQYYEYR